ncbi:glutaredoxin family protein [Streptomyces sp. 21So2-11]|uniref:glutaredoxin family protein n=1 Tax=Streptomyces sp. 21So2-11 TaxID=3144408 RepID=UPI00321A0540
MSPLLRRTKKRPDERLVTLVGKPGCHLCDDARAVVAAVCEEVGAAWEEKDITRDEELYRAYWEQVPVVLVDGEQHTFWRVDAARLRKALGG